MNLKSKNRGSSTMVVPVRRRLRTKTQVPAGSGGVPAHPGLLEMVYQDLEIVRNTHQVFRFNHPVVQEEMEEIQEEAQEEGRVGGVSCACRVRVGRVSGPCPDIIFQISSFPTRNVSFAILCQKMPQFSTLQHQNSRKHKRKRRN